MVEVTGTCPNCYKSMKVACDQVIGCNQIQWYKSYRCQHCDYSVEEDGDETPAELRKQLLVNDGTWALRLDESYRNAKTFKFLKSLLNLDMRAISKLKQRSSGIIYMGTKVEVAFYRQNLFAEGITTSQTKETI